MREPRRFAGETSMWPVAVLAALCVAVQTFHAAEAVGDIRGIVKDEQGKPLADVKVQMCGMEKLHNGTWRRELRSGIMRRYSTDKEGRFVVPVYEADMRFDFYCDKPGYAPTFLNAITNKSELNVVLKHGLTVTGTVKAMAGGRPEPVVGTQVELRLPNVDLWYQQRTMTDHDGRYTFHLAAVPDRGKWQVVFGGKVVQLDVKDGEPVKGPDFEATVIVGGVENKSAGPASHNFQPKAGFVPDAETAIKIALAVWEPIYGRDKIGGEKPYHAVLSNGVWTVEGSLPKGSLGGVAVAQIAKEDGRILAVNHGK